MDAASRVRGGEDIRNLFTAGGDGRMELSADLLIPRAGRDEFNQRAEASSTFVTYTVRLRLKQDDAQERIELEAENLTYIMKGEAARNLRFPHKPAWRESVVHADRKTPFVSTDSEARVVKLHQDRPRSNGTKKGGGRTWEFPLQNLPRTVLSSARNAQESPTSVLVRSALRHCRLLQLEPSALRRPDDLAS